MTRIVWQESFCTGIPGIDHEHRQLVEDLNEIFDLIDADADSARILESLGNVYGSISSHFALEEELMRRFGYDQYREHAADHHRLLDEIQDITQQFEEAHPVDAGSFKERLADWFQIHFSTFDARLHRKDFMLREIPAAPGPMSRARQHFKEILSRGRR